MRAQPGIVVTEAGKRDGKFVVTGLRDPLAIDPRSLLGEAGIDPARVVAHFDPYQALDPQSVLRRLEASLNPPPSVSLAIDGNRIVAQGSAPRLERWWVLGHSAVGLMCTPPGRMPHTRTTGNAR